MHRLTMGDMPMTDRIRYIVEARWTRIRWAFLNWWH